MREILFRGKRVDNGKWYFGSYLFLHVPDHDWTGARIGPEEDVHFIIDKSDLNIAVDPATVGQYTGLTDKNGVKIFEGDILRCLVPVYEIGQAEPVGDRWLIGVVIWNDTYSREPGSWELDAHDEHDNPTKYIFSSKFEVIGNIHDNPELMEGGAT